MSKAAMQMALEALEQLQGGCTDSDDGTVEAITVWCPEVIDALREALAGVARPGAEPVAWINEEQTIGPHYGKKSLSFEPFYSSNPLHYKHTPLYATPHTEAVRMSGDELWKLWNAQGSDFMDQKEATVFARAVEQATAARLGVKMGDV